MKNHHILKAFLCVLFYSLYTISTLAQSEDCRGAIPVCGNGDLNLLPNSAGGDDFSDPDNFAPECGFTESKSLWLFVKIKTAGSLGFVITPDNNACPSGLCDDYDFAIYGPNVPCGNLGRSIRCQSTNPQAAGIGGETGMRESEPANSFNGGPGAAGNGFVRWLDNVNPGESYYILVDNFDQRAGFSLSWTGTAELEDRITKDEGGVDLGTDITECSSTNVVLDATQPDGGTYEWSDGSMGPTFNVPVNTSGEYWVEVVNSSGCRSRDSVNVSFFDPPVANAVSDWQVCDPDGLFSFDLSTKDSEVLGTQSPTDHVITYHNSMADADSGTSPLPNPYTNTMATETIWARIAVAANTSCYDITSFELMVVTEATANEPDDLIRCDDNNDGVFSFDLTEVNAQVLGAQSETDFTITYHLMQSDADTGTNPIPSTFINGSNPQTIFVRIESILSSDCFNTTSFELRVFDSPTANKPTDWQVCDDNNDGLWSFDLTTKDAEVLAGQAAMDYSVTYHASQDDATNGNAPLTSPYTNTASSEVIFTRIENNLNVDCYETESFNIEVYNTPTANSLDLPLVTCSGGTTANFDLTLIQNEVADNQPGMIVTFYPNLMDAESEINAITTPDSYNSGTATIFAVVADPANNNCSAIGQVNLEVLSTPERRDPTPLEICSDSDMAVFDVASTEEFIRNGVSNLVVTFHATRPAAETGGAQITSPDSYTSASTIVYARSEANYEGAVCFVVSEIQLVVNRNPEAVDDFFVVCSDMGTGVFDLDSRIPILTNSASGVSVAFFPTQTDADNNNLTTVIASPFTSGSSTLYARIQNDATECFSVAELRLEIVRKPEFPGEIIIEECLKLGVATFDLAQKQMELSETEPRYGYTFHPTQEDAEMNSNPLPDVLESESATFYTRIQDLGTECFSIKPILLQITPTPEIPIDAILCVGEGYVLPDGVRVFEPGVYTVALQNPLSDCDEVIVTNLKLGTILFPNTFTPGGNNMNDVFRPQPNEQCTLEVTNYELTIWNRWGEEVFISTDFTIGWDGQFNGENAMSGVYLWRATYEFEGTAFEQGNSVILLR